MRDFLANLQRVDRRWVYLAVAVACAVPFLIQIRLPVYPTAETKGVYDCVERIPRDKNGVPTKVVLIDSGWDAGSMGENMGQAQAFIDHLFRNRISFVVVDLGGSDNAPQFINSVIDGFTKDKPGKDGKVVKAKYPGRNYGTDWVNVGYNMIGGWQTITVLAQDIHKLFPNDFYGNSTNDAKTLPLM